MTLSETCLGRFPVPARDFQSQGLSGESLMTTIRFAPILPAADPATLAEAVGLLQAGQIIVFPTDTVYGVGAHGLREAAVARLFDAKLRERDKAIPLLLSDASDVEWVGEDISPLARALMARYWPGGLTLVVRARPGLPLSLTAGGDTVAVRVPDHPTPRALARALGAPLAATSANVSGDPPATTAAQAATALADRVALVLDGGPSPVGVASSVIDCTVDPPRILRAGALAADPTLAALLAPRPD